MELVVQKGGMVVPGSHLRHQEVRNKGPYHQALPGCNFPVGYCLQAPQEHLHWIAQQLCAVSLPVIAADTTQVPLVARLQVPTDAERLDAAVLVLESFASRHDPAAVLSNVHGFLPVGGAFHCAV